MTPSKVPGSRNYRFDRVFPAPVGRISNSSGVSTVAAFRALDTLLADLWREGQIEALLKIKRGEITPVSLLPAKRAGRLGSRGLLADLALREPLWATVARVFGTPKRGTTTHRYVVSFAALRSTGALPDAATVGDLAHVEWNSLQSLWLTTRSGSDWMHLRRAVSRLLTLVLGDAMHEFRRLVLMPSIPTAREHKREPDLTPADFWRLVAELPEHHRPAVVAIAMTGMRLGEYLRCTSACLLQSTHALRVPGRKNEASNAVVYPPVEYWPWLEAAIPPARQQKALRTAFKRAARAIEHPELTIHDLRHCYVQWGIEHGATIPEAQKGARHADATMTLRYAARRDTGRMGEAVGRALTIGRKKA